MTLLEFITLPHLFKWGGVGGGDDCTTYPASWVLEKWGIDPAEGLRGTYSTGTEANAIVKAHGGQVGLVGPRLESIGFKRVQEPQDGDIGIVLAYAGMDYGAGTFKEIPGIRFGPLWSVMSLRGPQAKHLEWTGVAWQK